MNRLNWVQQSEDYKTKYHVIKWKTSHFHEPYSKQIGGSAKLKQGAAPAAVASKIQTEAEGLGFMRSDRTGSGKMRLGFGLEESLGKNLAGEEAGRDGVSISGRGMEGQVSAGGAARDALQGMAVAELHAAENSVTPVTGGTPESEALEREQAKKDRTTVAQSGRGNIRNRLRESAARLREAYQRQKEKAARIPLKQVRKEETEKKEKKGTRQMADRETMLSMQAENHYLLDSYDATGNYSMLGKK